MTESKEEKSGRTFTQEIGLLKSTDEVEGQIKSDSAEIANKIKDLLIKESMMHRDGSARVEFNVPAIYYDIVSEALIRWAKMHSYNVTCMGDEFAISPKLKSGHISLKCNRCSSKTTMIYNAFATMLFSAALSLIIIFVASSTISDGFHLGRSIIFWVFYVFSLGFVALVIGEPHSHSGTRVKEEWRG